MMKTSLAFPSERPTTANTERKVPKIPLNMFSICSLPLVLCVKNERAKYLPPTLNFCIHSLCNLLVGSERSVSHVRAWFQTRTSQVNNSQMYYFSLCIKTILLFGRMPYWPLCSAASLRDLAPPFTILFNIFFVHLRQRSNTQRRRRR